MGIGFDAFKANIGWSLADSLLGAISDAIEDKNAEQKARSLAENTEQNKQDMLKALVFFITHNIGINRTIKKAIADLFSEAYQERISLFSIEDKINSVYEMVINKSPADFFTEIESIYFDRDNVKAIYLYLCLLYIQFDSEQEILPAHPHNLYLIKKYFRLTHEELAECYGLIGKISDQDIDDIADTFEELTSEEKISEIENKYPSLLDAEEESYKNDKNNSIHNSTKQEKIEEDESEDESEIYESVFESTTFENPIEEIKNLYNKAIYEAGDNSSDFGKHVFLADSNPEFVMNAVRTYAKDCVGEEAILVFDDTFTKSCKDGFLLTNKNIFIGLGGKIKAKLPLCEINFIDVSFKTFATSIKINTTEIFSEQILKKGTIALANLLKEIIPIAMQIKN
ncbi:MAG: hypothetical protein II821_03880 [Treponema sp.]|nr:hypothetical protein [Treponema sp.]